MSYWHHKHQLDNVQPGGSFKIRGIGLTMQEAVLYKIIIKIIIIIIKIIIVKIIVIIIKPS